MDTTPANDTTNTNGEQRAAEIDAELAALRAKRQEVASRRQAAADKREPIAALERERRALADEQAIEAAETEHGPDGEKIRVVQTSLGVIIVRRAHSVAYKRFMDLKTTRTEDCEKLARPCVIYPDSAALDRITTELPATWLRLVGALTKLAGFRSDEIEEK